MKPQDSPARPLHGSAGRYAALDGLRGVAIAMVLWNHLVEAYLPLGRASWLGWLRAGTGLSWTGVDLFFALSGFFIGGILIDQRDSPRLVRVFYLRRAARILPLYYVTLAVCAAEIFGGLPGSYHRFPGWVYILFLSNIAIGLARTWDWLPLSVLWSLAVEEQFYITAPWIARWIHPSRIPWLIAGLLAVSESARAVMLVFHPGGHLALQVVTLFRLDGLALGVLVAWAVRSDDARPLLERFGAHWRSWLLVGSVLFGVLALLRPQQGSTVLALAGYPLIAAEFAMILTIVAKIQPRCLNRCLEFQPLVHLGRHSYFIYLWHGLLGFPLIRWLGGPAFILNSLPGLGLVLMAAGATWLAAAVSWRWFEGPIVAWGHRHAY